MSNDDETLFQELNKAKNELVEMNKSLRQRLKEEKMEKDKRQEIKNLIARNKSMIYDLDYKKSLLK